MNMTRVILSQCHALSTVAVSLLQFLRHREAAECTLVYSHQWRWAAATSRPAGERRMVFDERRARKHTNWQKARSDSARNTPL